MFHPARRALPLLIPLIIAACVFLLGIRWGLPSRAADRYLFGERTPWSGNDILALAGGWEAGSKLGADVDLNPLTGRAEPVVLNESDAQRAEIVRRYRLFSHQPDEMITFRALAQMRPGQFQLDPKLYQYGGLWMYPVGAMLKLASMAGWVTLRDDLAFYLDHPEQFCRFYVVARVYTVLWGLVGAWAVYWIVRRMTGRVGMAVIGATLYAVLPVVVNMAHEAKPHLPGAVLMMLACIAGAKYVETGRTRWWLLTGALCGAAFGMVISSLLGFAIIPVMALLRNEPWSRRVRVTVGAGLVGLIVYWIANPYVFLHAFTPWGDRQILESNLSNSTAMYEIDPAGFANAARLLGAGTSPVLAAAGAVGGAALVLAAVARKRQGTACDSESCLGRGDVGWLLLAPVVLILVQFVLLATGKPGEYARFALLPEIALGIAAVVAVDRFVSTRAARYGVLGVLLLVTAAHGLTYVVGFVRDAGPHTSRLAAAEELRDGDFGTDVGLYAEPAPYSCPPINLFTHRLVLLPPLADAPDAWRYTREPVDFTLWAVDAPVGMIEDGPVGLPTGRTFGRWPFETPISWADKTFVYLPQSRQLGAAGAAKSDAAVSP